MRTADIDFFHPYQTVAEQWQKDHLFILCSLHKEKATVASFTAADPEEKCRAV
jgi:hypothetical protein